MLYVKRAKLLVFLILFLWGGPVSPVGAIQSFAAGRPAANASLAAAGEEGIAADDARGESREADLSGKDESGTGEDSGFEEDLDADLEEALGMGIETPAFTWRLDAAFENYIDTDRDQDFEDADKKSEISAGLEIRYGTSRNYLFSVTEAYFHPTFINSDIGADYPYSEETEFHRNLRISSKDSELMARELYYSWLLGKYRIRIGNQIFGWGTADFINSTSYLNPADLRELVFKDQDDLRLGVPAVSGMIFLSDYTVELVFVPLHIAAALPSTNHYWAVKFVEGSYPVIFKDSEPLDADAENFGYAGRISTTFRGMDMSLSAYHGPDNEPVLVPSRTVLIPNQPVALLIDPEYFVADFVGADFSMDYEDFVFQAETAYSPDRTGFVKQNTDLPQYLKFPFETKKSGFVSYSVGFNYFIPLHQWIPGHTGDTLFTAEWYDAMYLDDDINPPQITDFLTARFQDDYFDKRIHLSLTGIFETRGGGMVFWPEAEYDFKNGFKLELAYVGINAGGENDFDEDSVFYYFRDNDFVMVNLRYAYP